MGSNPSRFVNVDQPVEKVSWSDCMKFCEKLTDQFKSSGLLPENLHFSLPTEAQWEHACRAGTSTRFHSGDSESDLEEVAWYSSKTGFSTEPVGTKKSNNWGLFDMHGNVREWCLDYYGDYPPFAVEDYTGPSQGSLGVVRGGGIYSHHTRCRSAERFRMDRDNISDDVGFRIVLCHDN
jgi:formylglycine-generating enzyme required for sulfatase activity